MDFHYPSLNDRQRIEEIFNGCQPFCCEYCFGNIMMWSEFYNNKICLKDGLFVSGDFTDEPYFCYPVGEGDKKSLIEELIEATKNHSEPLRFYGLTEKERDELNSLFGGRFEIREERDRFDYLYRTEDLALLAGRKYHGKRNHISFFENSFNWNFEPITRGNIKDCILLNEHWYSLNRHKNPEEIAGEYTAVQNGLKNYFDLDFEGGILTVENEIVAFSFGEKLNDRTFCTHIEKAYSDIRGAYQMINRELAKSLLGKYEFINREEDTGSEGLRSAKLSYHPYRLVVKYSAVFKG